MPLAALSNRLHKRKSPRQNGRAYPQPRANSVTFKEPIMAISLSMKAHMTKPYLPPIPNFLLKWPAVCDQATTLWLRIPREKDPVKAQRALEQLIANKKMEGVWKEIYRKKRGKHDQFFNPARLTNASQAAALREQAQELRKKASDKDVEDAKILDHEAILIERLPQGPVSTRWSEQECASRQFLTRAYRIALDDREPEILSDLQAKVDKLRNISGRLRELARELESMGEYVFPNYVDQIEDVADDCEDDAKVLTPSLVNSPWIIVREGKNPRLRTTVAKLAYCTYHLFQKILPSTIAAVTNVIEACGETSVPGNTVNRDRVRQILGEHHHLTIRPTFGRLVYPMLETHDRKYLRSLRNRRSRTIDSCD
jgi:hypothetical protein